MQCVTYSSVWGHRAGWVGGEPSSIVQNWARGKKMCLSEKMVFRQTSQLVYCEYYPYSGVGSEIRPMLTLKTSFCTCTFFCKCKTNKHLVQFSEEKKIGC